MLDKKTITKREFYEALGALSLARKYRDLIQDLTRDLATVLHEPRGTFGDYGHVSDFIWEDGDIQILLEKLHIEVY